MNTEQNMQELRDSLRALLDLQNGPPLEKYRREWEIAVANAEKALAEPDVTITTDPSIPKREITVLRDIHIDGDDVTVARYAEPTLEKGPAVAVNEQMLAALQGLVDIENGPGMAVIGWQEAMLNAEDAIAAAKAARGE